jgi:hypothetical protein
LLRASFAASADARGLLRVQPIETEFSCLFIELSSLYEAAVNGVLMNGVACANTLLGGIVKSRP